MNIKNWTLTTFAAAFLLTQTALAADQTVVGEGNARAMKLASQSPLVISSMELLKSRLKDFKSNDIRKSLAELTTQEKSCIQHRAHLNAEQKQNLINALDQAGLIDATEGSRVQGGLMAGIFPPVLHDGTDCPQVPLA